jgi:hypothetical protein
LIGIWLFNPDEVQGVLGISGATQSAGLADLSNASHFHDRGFLLSICKARGFFMVGIQANKPLTVFVKHGDLPVMMFSPSVFPERCAFPNYHLEKYTTLDSLSI